MSSDDKPFFSAELKKLDKYVKKEYKKKGKSEKYLKLKSISSFFARRAKKASAEGRSPPQELEVSPRSGLYLLVYFKVQDVPKGQRGT